MSALATTFAGRVAETLDAPTTPIPVLTGSCGTGRTSVLLGIRELIGPRVCQYVDVERVATTPERFLQSLIEASPFQGAHPAPTVKGPREAFDASLAFLSSACTNEGQPATFLLDEVLDLRTFESFPGLRSVVTDLVGALESSPNRFVLATRFSTRAAKLANLRTGRLQLQPVPRMALEDVKATLAETPHRLETHLSDDDVAKTVLALTDGRSCYVRALADAMSSMTDHGGADPIGALVALLSAGGALAARCRFCYELRLHRARGYGALKAILDVLADEEPLTLTAISRRLARTPGSTKDYLGWLEDVDLIVSERKRYRVADPLLRLWIRLQSRPSPPSEETIVAEVQRYTMLMLAAAARAATQAETPERPTPISGDQDATPTEEVGAGRQRPTGIVELD